VLLRADSNLEADDVDSASPCRVIRLWQLPLQLPWTPTAAAAEVAAGDCCGSDPLLACLDHRSLLLQ
jgi:hypothetical protein